MIYLPSFSPEHPKPIICVLVLIFHIGSNCSGGCTYPGTMVFTPLYYMLSSWLAWPNSNEGDTAKVIGYDCRWINKDCNFPLPSPLTLAIPLMPSRLLEGKTSAMLGCSPVGLRERTLDAYHRQLVIQASSGQTNCKALNPATNHEWTPLLIFPSWACRWLQLGERPTDRRFSWAPVGLVTYVKHSIRRLVF